MTVPSIRRQDYSLDDEQGALQETVARFFEHECSAALVRATEPLGFDAELWQKVTQADLPSMALPERWGGSGASLVELVLVADEIGRAAAPIPFVSFVCAARLLAAHTKAGVTGPVAEALVSGAGLIALALRPASGHQRQLVPDAAVADWVVALVDDQLVLCPNDPKPPVVPNEGQTPLAWWAPPPRDHVIPLAHGDQARRQHAGAVAEWKLLTAAALIGLTDAALALAVDFAKSRMTLGVAIGALQGVAFPLTDVAIEVAGGRNLIRRAAWLAVHEPEQRPDLVAMALPWAAHVATRGTRVCAHLHGGLGFTLEADVSLYFLRAKGWAVLAGDPARGFIEAARVRIARTATSEAGS